RSRQARARDRRPPARARRRGGGNRAGACEPFTARRRRSPAGPRPHRRGAVRPGVVMYPSLRAFVERLDAAGELVRIGRECDPRLEIAAIADRTMKLPGGGPALLFEHPRGSRFPLLINAFGSSQRMAWALGVEAVEEHARALAEMLG